MIVADAYNKFRKSLLYIGCSNDKISFYRFQNAFINTRNMVYLVNKLSTNSNCIGIDNCITIMGNEINFNKFIDEKNYGNVKFEIHQNEFDNYRVLFFRRPSVGSEVISQLHLYNDEILYARVAFDYQKIGDSYRKSIINQLIKKYHLYKEVLVDNSVILQDFNKNRLKIIDDGKIILQYISGNQKLINAFYFEASMERDYAFEEEQRQQMVADFI